MAPVGLLTAGGILAASLILVGISLLERSESTSSRSDTAGRGIDLWPVVYVLPGLSGVLWSVRALLVHFDAAGVLWKPMLIVSYILLGASAAFLAVTFNIGPRVFGGGRHHQRSLAAVVLPEWCVERLAETYRPAGRDREAAE
jgi:hypothetical protein